MSIAESRPGVSSVFGFHELLEALPTAVYTTDADGYVTSYNQAAAELAGRTPRLGEDRWTVTWRLWRPDGSPLPFDECPMAVALRTGEPVRNVEVIAERPDGKRVAFMPFPTPLRDESGKLIGAINMLVELGAVKEAQALSARRAEEQAALYRFTDRLYRAESTDDVYDAGLDAILGALHCSRASILMFDDVGVMQFVAARGLSAAYRKAVTGHTPWSLAQPQPEPITMDDVGASDMGADLKDTIQGEGLNALGFFPIVADGGVVGKFMAYFDKPHAFSGEEIDLALVIARQLGFYVERTRAAAALISTRSEAHGDRERLVSIVENSNDAIISKDLNGIIKSWNAGAERLFGYTADEIIGKHVTTLMPPDRVDEEPGIIERIRRGERIEHYETVRRRKSGEDFDVSLTVSPLKDAQGRIVGASKIGRDITDRKHADRQRTLLIHELNHRVKNTLATVQSLAMQTLRNTERSEQARALLDARLSALSRAHDVLTAENWEGADMGDVVRRALEAFRATNTQVEIAGPHVRLTPKQALALSLALHELATNAAKYGALSNDAGVVRIAWQLTPAETGPQIELTWTERGGPPVAAPTRQGFGSRLIERNLAHELGGTSTIAYPASGVEAKIVSPVEVEDYWKRGDW